MGSMGGAFLTDRQWAQKCTIFFHIEILFPAQTCWVLIASAISQRNEAMSVCY